MEAPKKSILKTLFDYSLPILLAIGAIFLIIYYGFKIFANDNTFTTYSNILNDFHDWGLAIVGSGVFFAVLKWIQFKGFFREELHAIINSSEFEKRLETSVYNVVYSDEFLKNQKDLVNIWRRVNKVLFKNEFPDEIAGKIETRMQELFFENSKLSHYYKNLIYTINISLDDNGFLTINESSEFKIVRQEKSKFKFDFKYNIEKIDNTDNTSSIQFNSVSVDKTPLNLNNVEIVKENDKELVKRIPIELEGQTDYEMVSNINLIYNIEKDYEYQLYFERFVDYFRVEVNYSANLRVIFLSIGNEQFEDVKSTDLSLVKVYRSMLLPESGFRLIFVKK